MNRLRETEDEQALENDREISLGMPTILGIFFAIALVCACFFGFGYSLGTKVSSVRGRCGRSRPRPGQRRSQARGRQSRRNSGRRAARCKSECARG
jgi:hypothetical protein